MSRWDTPERVALRALAKDVVAKEIAPHVDEWEQAGELPRSLHKAFARAGLLGIAFPEEVGGQGGDCVDAAIVTDASKPEGVFSRVCDPTRLNSFFSPGITLEAGVLRALDDVDRAALRETS